MKRAKPTLWLAFGLVSLTVMLVSVAYSLGFIPDGTAVERDARAKVAEALAVQMAGAVQRGDETTMAETLASVVERNADVLSIALRDGDGDVVTAEGDHEAHWVASADGRSTPTHVLVPLIGADGPQGQIEIAFAEPSSGGEVYGFPLSIVALIAFLAGTGFVAYYLMLRRALKQLDPGRVVPERVQKAFDTLSEGVILLDERERILLVNDAFAAILGERPKPGTNVNNLSWRMPEGHEKDGGYVWHTSIREGREMRGEALGLRTATGTMHNLTVGATAITGERDEIIGAIVTVGNVTRLRRSEEDLEKTASRLAEREQQIARQTRELEYLTDHDTLSGCLNRRAFFSRVERMMANHPEVAVMVIEIDAFHDIVEGYGPAVTDRLVGGLGKLLSDLVPDGALVARHRGEEFVVALVGDGGTAEAFATVLRERLTTESGSILPNHGSLSVSVGIGLRAQTASMAGGMEETAYHLIHRADRALGQRHRGANPIEKSAPTHVAAELPTEAASQAGDAVARAAFERTLARALADAEHTERPFAVLSARISSWEYLREALGERLTNLLAEQVGEKIRALLRGQGDALALPDTGEVMVELRLAKPDDVAFSVQDLMRALARPFHVGGRDVYVAVKIGAAMFPDDGRDPATLVRHATIAMRRAIEEEPTGGMRFYSAAMTQASERRMNIESGIREALANDQFELFYQPIVCAKTGAVAAAEALLRHSNERLQGVYVDEIISVAERSNLSEEIDEWVVRRGLRQMHEWCDAGLVLPKVSLNVSARQLSNVAFMDRIFEAIREVRFSPTRVQIEVTETAKLADVEVAAPQLKRLQGLGVQIALDDFGTGQASLTYLQRLHPDTLKIDRSFINGITVNHANATLVAAMTVMAHCLGVRVVVEGVEEDAQLDFLRETGCDEIQGYLISKPMPRAVMSGWLDLFVRENGAKDFVSQVTPTPLAPGEMRPGENIAA